MEHCIDLYMQGKSLKAYQYFGSTVLQKGTMFRVYAPHARSVRVVGDFNEWNKEKHYMNREDNGVFSLFIDKVKEGCIYKYVIEDEHKNIVYKSDPYAFYSEQRPLNASIVYCLDDYTFNDQQWLEQRTLCFDEPVLIYEVHVGSWFMDKMYFKDQVQSFFSYEDKVDALINYLKEMHYTHVEFMPLTEYPDDRSWGYLGTGFFSATSRYGTPKQLMYLIDQLHQASIGVLLDFVLSHFVCDDHGLRMFDGKYLFERNEMSEWGSCYFDYSKGTVCSFMMSALMFWVDYFHIDGFRMDAVSHLIYNLGNKSNGEYKDGIHFLQYMNQTMKEKHPTVMMIAEDSSSYIGVTKEVCYGGLGFDYKWDLGWMNDTLSYLSEDPIYHKGMHDKITFSMAYFSNERYILPLSHDEVVHGKKTIVDKMYGSYYDKFSLARTMYVYMMMHPGKKLNFMMNDLGELKEFDEDVGICFDLLHYPIHDSFHLFIKDVQQLVVQYPSLYHDYCLNNFEWIVVDDIDQSIFVFERTNKQEVILCILNFNTNNHPSYTIPVRTKGTYKEVINSDCFSYSGRGFINEGVFDCSEEDLVIKVAPLSGSVFVLEHKEDFDV